MERQVLHLPNELAAIVLAAAARAYPSECCGLIEGIDTADGWYGFTIHETANLAPDPAAHFLVDPEVQFALLKALRNSGRCLIGCFHSHPNGRPEPSDTDLATAAEDGFLWLIAAGDSSQGFSLSAHVFEAPRKLFRKVAIAP